MYGDLPYIKFSKETHMFSGDTVTPTKGKMEARKELRLHRADEEKIKAAAAATGLQEADFIRQAALMRARDIERSMSLSLLPKEAFEAFKTAIEAPGKVVPGLADAARSTEGLLKDGG